MIDLTAYKLIVFDKDGTLIDFDAMWGGWVEALADRLAVVTGLRLAPALFAVMGYDAVAHRTIAGGPLAVRPMSELRALTGGVLSAQRLSDAEVELLLATAWQIPDPATTARPLADLPRLFAGLRERGLKIAIATSDDRAATLATLTQLRVAQMVDVVIAADDGVPLKPKPDMVWVACQATQVAPRQAIVVGDAWPELQMARAAQAGLAIGVTSGVSNADMLAALADVIMTNVDELLA